MPTAVLIDGGFFLKRFPYVYRDRDANDPRSSPRRCTILDPMWNHIHSSLNEHIDGLRSTSPNPDRSGQREEGDAFKVLVRSIPGPGAQGAEGEKPAT